jgi:hypothetical protein
MTVGMIIASTSTVGEEAPDSLVEGDPVGRVGCWADGSTNGSGSQGPM